MVDRMTGLATGLDTEALVKQMMALSQSRYDNIMKKKTETEWRKQLYDDIYADLKSFDSKLFDASLSTFNAPKIATSSNESIATITASTTASSVNHTLKVNQLATSASMTSSQNITTGSSKNTLGEQIGFTGTATLVLKNDAGQTKNIDVDSTKSISDIVKQINESGLGIKATYDSNTDRLFINSTTTGKASSFSLTASDDNGKELLNKLGLNNTNGVAEAIGQNSEIVLDGTTFSQSSNNFTIAGLTFDLKTADKNQELTINVKADTAKLVDNVKDLIQSYNDLLDMINGKTTEKYYRDYNPLTDEQRKEMTEDEIKLWEEKAKSGILRNDSILTGLTSKMRTAMYSAYDVDGTFKTLSSIGISTKSYQDKGKLTIDEEKLAKALEEDPDAVSKLLTGDGGLVDTLRKELKSSMTQMEQKSGAGKIVDTESSWAKEIRRYSDQMDTMSAKMITEENRYYSQFATLEKTINNLNSSSSYMLSMFGS